MRARGSTITDTHFYQELVCKRCGINESIKLTIEEYEAFLNAKRKEESRTASTPQQQFGARRISHMEDSIGRQIFGKQKSRHSKARRTSKRN